MKDAMKNLFEFCIQRNRNAHNYPQININREVGGRDKCGANEITLKCNAREKAYLLHNAEWGMPWRCIHLNCYIWLHYYISAHIRLFVYQKAKLVYTGLYKTRRPHFDYQKPKRLFLFFIRSITYCLFYILGIII